MQTPGIMDYDALKEQWGEVEDRDGVRLSWNVFPSSRMVSLPPDGRGARALKLMPCAFRKLPGWSSPSAPSTPPSKRSPTRLCCTSSRSPASSRAARF